MRWWHTHIHLGLQIQDLFWQPDIVVGVGIKTYWGGWLQRLYQWPFVMTFCHWYIIAWLKDSWRWRYDGDSSSWRCRYCFDDILHNGGNLKYVLNNKTLHWLQCLKSDQWQQRSGRGVASPAWDIQIDCCAMNGPDRWGWFEHSISEASWWRLYCNFNGM